MATEQEKLGQAIADMKRYFPNSTASERADKVQELSGLLPHITQQNGNGVKPTIDTGKEI